MRKLIAKQLTTGANIWTLYRPNPLTGATMEILVSLIWIVVTVCAGIGIIGGIGGGIAWLSAKTLNYLGRRRGMATRK